MTPHKQLFRHRPDQGTWGDCYRTAVACLLDLAPGDVPHVYDKGVDGETGMAVMRDFLASRGFVSVAMIYPGEWSLEEVLAHREQQVPGCAFLLIGRSRNNTDHVVVAKGGTLVWDPSLDDSGIVGPCGDGFWWCEYLGALL